MATKTKKSPKEVQPEDTSSFEVFEASPFDLDQLATLFDAYRQFYRQASDIAGAREFLSARMKNKDSVIFIAANEDGELVGFTQLYPLLSSVGMKKIWLLNDLFVDNGNRRKGISKLLIQRCKKYAGDTNANGLHLETEKSNTIGNQLYPSEGFDLNTTSNFYFWSCK
ncbi:MAG: GNAT family N-acetyltransferase [Bacteroidia bacterium]|nr:GNAT family N-acetyltransferase [Bacteroidia bacterium]